MSHTIKILVADDEQIGRQLLEAILVPEGYDLIFATNGEEALQAALEQSPDVILLDVMMPKLDGFELCKILRNKDITAHIPIYLITALDDRDSRLKGIDAGAYDYISKPFDRIEITAKIKNVVRQIKIYKRNHKGESPAPENIQAINTDRLLSGLYQLVCRDQTMPGNLKMFRKLSQDKSSNILIVNETSQGNYYSIIGNSEMNNIVLLYCILGIILKKTIEQYGGGPQNIIDHFRLMLDNFIKENNLDFLENNKTSILVIHQSLNKEIFISSSSENTIFLRYNNNPTYISNYLQDNLEIKLDNLQGIIALGPLTTGEKERQELTLKLNNMLRNDGSIDPEELSKVFSVPDLLIINLTFS